MKTVMALLLASALLAGCSSKPQSDVTCDRDDATAQCRYLRDVQQQLMGTFNATVAPRYPGQTCLVSAHRRADGGYSVLRIEGDEALCLRAWQQVSSARNLPLPPVGVPEDWQFAFGSAQ
ncbi:cell envelope biogenesis protein TolA [Candidatus Pantoea deserta]|uniref:Cell envelope biogenesis protein TolA n=1 Tax=Candidatus Pantoea deserta TaxID=1869313 RepID=A0A3N4PIH4_9GAMM|nr:cell envelope integrity protein TolA [Pantoea deserta]RPE03540.1 cell envelope biogenesis protein TolA [Pantoea deserta]